MINYHLSFTLRSPILPYLPLSPLLTGAQPHPYPLTKKKKGGRELGKSWPARPPNTQAARRNECRVIPTSHSPSQTDTPTPGIKQAAPGHLTCMHSLCIFLSKCAELSSWPGTKKKARSPLPLCLSQLAFQKVCLVLDRCLWAQVDVCLPYRDNPSYLLVLSRQLSQQD